MAIFETKNIKKLFLWAFVITILSILGFLLYIIFGNDLKFKAKNEILSKRKSTKYYLNHAKIYLPDISTTYINNISKYIKNTLKCDIWNDNNIDIFINGEDFFKDLLKNIESAKNHIHLEFFIFADDKIGKQLSEALIKKAKQGLDVKIIYDAFGSRKTKPKFWCYLKQNGIKVESFFPPLFKTSLLNFKINYRNHRKIIIIDGKIAYTGGINIRKDHINKDKKLYPWRDTQIKIVGSGVYAVQDIFLNDWCICSNSKFNDKTLKQYFPKPLKCNKYSLQIIDDGPDYETQRILDCYLKIIKNAKKFIYIQTPYFVICDDLKNALIDAHNRGININIFIPQKPDKKIVYGASLLNIKPLLYNEINIYLYKGFIHSKVLITDECVCIGTCNFDYRSFFLNFELTCLCFNKNFISKNVKIIKNDFKNSNLLTKKQYFKLKTKNLIAICFYKLISKIL